MSFITISIFCKSAFTHLNFTWASCLYQSKLAIQRTFLRKRTKYTIHDFDEWSGWRMKLILHSSTSLVEIINQTHYTIRSLVNSAFHLVFLLIDQFLYFVLYYILNKESAFMNHWRPSWNDSWMLILYEVDS
jgi:hypothetical protein